MNPGEATFEIQKVYFITGRSDTFVAGRIKEGQVRMGMCAKALADGGLSMVARIKSIEDVRDLSDKSNLALALDTPEEDERQLWKGLCRAGDILVLQPQMKNG